MINFFNVNFLLKRFEFLLEAKFRLQYFGCLPLNLKTNQIKLGTKKMLIPYSFNSKLQRAVFLL